MNNHDSLKIKKLWEELNYFKDYPRKEIPLKEIEKVIINKIGCKRERSKGGSAVKYSHTYLEDHPYFTFGIFSIHLIHGKSKNKPQIRRNDFKQYLLPPLQIILEKMERE